MRDCSIAETRTKLLRTTDPAWALTEEGFTLAREHEVESLFAIGNGHVGTRASLEEGSELSAPATFVAGVFEHTNAPGDVPQLVTFPDWSGVEVWTNGRPLSMHEGSVLDHWRVLDFKQGVLWREWRHRDADGRITRFNSLRFASLADRRLLVQWMMLTAENYCPALYFESSIQLGPGIRPLLPASWNPAPDPEAPNTIPLVLSVPGGEPRIRFCLSSQMLAPAGKESMRQVKVEGARIVEKFYLKAGAGSQCELFRLVTVHSGPKPERPAKQSSKKLADIHPSSLWAVASAHASEWRDRWETADVQIEGDDRVQQALRFAVYHLISAANPEDSRVSIGARALTGKAYKGHVFWDTEIYMLPFYLHTHPESARGLLGYRYHTLPAARERARGARYRGAMYAWRAA